MKELVRRIKTSASTPLLTVLLEGAIGSGKTALACQAALDSGFPFVKLVSPDMFLDASERGKCSELTKVFEDAYKSELSLIILDNLERLLGITAVLTLDLIFVNQQSTSRSARGSPTPCCSA